MYLHKPNLAMQTTTLVIQIMPLSHDCVDRLEEGSNDADNRAPLVSDRFDRNRAVYVMLARIGEEESLCG